LAEAKLAKMDLRAPFSGIIGLRSVSMGDYVKEGADLVNLESIDPLKVDFRVPEIYMRQVKVGQPLQVQLDALPGRTFEGKVFAVNPLIDAAGRSVVIRAMVRNPDTSLRPGMFARVRLITRDAQDALVLPEEALVPQGDQQFVYRILDGKAVRTKVDVGQRRDSKVEILNGVDKDDVVVTAGQLKLRDGAPVNIAGTAPPAPTVAAPAPMSSPASGPAMISPATASPAKADAVSAPAPKS
jgi:membrane fusion protein (multidrug efflux system)